MDQRVKLDALLKARLGSNNVYFQPPESVRMNYPAIVYERSVDYTVYADNQLYYSKEKYSVTVIDSDPDSKIPAAIASIPLTRMNRRYTAHNLYHTVFTIYY